MLRMMLLLIGFGVAVFAHTTLWKVTYAGKTLYIGGTVHMLRASDYPLPMAYDKAFSASDILVFETDLAAMKAPETAIRMREQLMYGPGQSLHATLQKKTYMALKAYAAQNALPVQMLDQMKPPLVVMTVMQLELQRLSMTAPGVDQHYFTRAVQLKKEVRWFESIQEQINMVSSIGREDVDGMIMENLEETAEYKTVWGQMLSAWREGNTDTLLSIGRKYLVNESPADYRRLIVTRNQKWMEQLIPMLRSRETEFVLVGSLHLVGPDGLIAQLRHKGYKVEQL